MPSSNLSRHLRVALHRAGFSSSILAFLFFGFSGCATTDNYSFIRTAQTTDASGRVIDPTQVPDLSDALALNYASSVATILRCKFNGARIAREVSSTAQVALAALGGAAAAFNYSAKTVTALSLGSAGIPELQRIFDAKGRAQVYQDAVRLIEQAEIEYLALNQKPSNKVLTQNGVTLFQRVTSSIHVVEKTLAGTLPSVEDMQKATERMSTKGATPTKAGTPALNNIAANQRVEAAVSEPVREPQTISTAEFEALKAKMAILEAEKEFVANIKKVERAPNLTAEQKKQVYLDVLTNAGLEKNVEPDPNAINQFFSETASPDQRSALAIELKKRITQ
jgi:hypothetical protein